MGLRRADEAAETTRITGLPSEPALGPVIGLRTHSLRVHRDFGDSQPSGSVHRLGNGHSDLVIGIRRIAQAVLLNHPNIGVSDLTHDGDMAKASRTTTPADQIADGWQRGATVPVGSQSFGGRLGVVFGGVTASDVIEVVQAEEPFPVFDTLPLVSGDDGLFLGYGPAVDVIGIGDGHAVDRIIAAEATGRAVAVGVNSFERTEFAAE